MSFEVPVTTTSKRMPPSVGEKDHPSNSPLTEREREVLQLMAKGKENAEIAAKLVITERTVKFHVGNIYAKLGATSRTAAVVEAIRRKWVDV